MWGFRPALHKLGSRPEPGQVCLPLKHVLGEEEEGVTAA